MKKSILVLFGLVAVAGVAIALAAGVGDSPASGPEAADMVVLGEEDLADRAEILRNMYRRITPPGLPLVQDVGTWPAAWEEFGANWGSAAAEREYGAWVVPVEVSQDAGVTVVKDGNGTVLWRGRTDFARMESAGVVLTGELVGEEEWEGYEGVRDAVIRLGTAGGPPALPVRTGATNGLRFTAHEWTTNDTFRLELAYETDTNVDIFAYAVAHTSAWVVATWTNDENVAVTDTNLVWYPAGPPFNGKQSAWKQRGTVGIDSGVGEFEDSGFAEELSRLRFYAAAVAEDSDGDGLNDGWETFVSHTDPTNQDSDGDGLHDGIEVLATHTDPNNSDSDHDGIGDATELAAGTSPNRSNVWWVTTTTNAIHEWVGLGTNIPIEPKCITNYWIVVTNRPTTNSVVCDVKVSGYVDDILCVDSNVLGGWNRGPTNFTALSVLAQTTNAQSGRLDLELWDWPDEGHSGENEVKLGASYECPFLVEWEWWVPIDIRMEPIWTSADLPLDNPSGVILGSNAWFHVDILPEGIVPEEKIVWTSLSNKLEFVTTNCGSRVQVRGDALGEDALRVEVEGAEGDFGLPPFHVKVMPLTVVTAKVGVVVTNGGSISTTQTDRINSAICEANLVVLQTGRQIVLADDIQEIEDPTGSFYDVALGTDAAHELRTKLSQPGGMEIYFVNSITSTNGGHPVGANHPTGMLIGAQGTGRTVAHETCHACGACDIYEEHAGTDLTASGEIREEWMPQDWGAYSTGEMPSPDISDFVQRLLMYGYTVTNTIPKGDVPTGSVYGLGNWGPPLGWENDLWGVGLPALLHAPVHN